jgi:integrase
MIMKAPNGFGTSYKLSGKRRKPWIARITIGRDPIKNKDGSIKLDTSGNPVIRQKCKTIGYFESQEEARDALTLYRQGYISPRQGITLKDLLDEWFEAKVERVSYSSQNNYVNAIKRLEPLFHISMKDLRTAHMQRVVDQCSQSGLARSTLTKMKAVLTMVYDYAAQNDIVLKNYASFIVLPKHIRSKKEVFNDFELKALWDNSVDPIVQSILILIYSGMRISEMLKLTRFNVDMDKKIIRGGVKTDAGKDRVIPIHPKTLPFVKNYLSLMGDRLICDERGKAYSAERYRMGYYYPTLQRLAIRRLTPHACRHTFATLMAAAHADTLSIQQIMGHTDYAMTANVYSHLQIETLHQAIEKI